MTDLCDWIDSDLEHALEATLLAKERLFRKRHLDYVDDVEIARYAAHIDELRAEMKLRGMDHWRWMDDGEHARRCGIARRIMQRYQRNRRTFTLITKAVGL